jgi:hypothetical protein
MNTMALETAPPWYTSIIDVGISNTSKAVMRISRLKHAVIE